MRVSDSFQEFGNSDFGNEFGEVLAEQTQNPPNKSKQKKITRHVSKVQLFPKLRFNNYATVIDGQKYITEDIIETILKKYSRDGKFLTTLQLDKLEEGTGWEVSYLTQDEIGPGADEFGIIVMQYRFNSDLGSPERVNIKAFAKAIIDKLDRLEKGSFDHKLNREEARRIFY